MYKDENDYELIYMISENEDAKEIFFEKYKPFIINKAKVSMIEIPIPLNILYDILFLNIFSIIIPP